MNCTCDYSYTCPYHQREIEIENNFMDLRDRQKDIDTKLGKLADILEMLHNEIRDIKTKLDKD